MSAIGWAAHFAVIFFFVLSGYAIIGGIIEEIKSTGSFDLKDYAIRRVARVYPPYLVTIVLVLIYFSIFESEGFDTSAAATLRSLPFAFTGRDAIVLTPVWSLRIEVVLYTVAGLTAFAIVSSGVVRQMCAALAVGLTFLMCWRLSFGYEALAYFISGGMLHAFSGAPRANTESQFWRILAPLGGWSYSLYLCHMPIILVSMSATSGFDPALRVAIAVIVANVVSAMLARVIERPKEIAATLRLVLQSRVAVS